MPLSLPTDQKGLQRLVDRRHPGYERQLRHWEFCRATYDGGREWFEENLFRYIKEGDQEFKDRKARAYRFNHTREVVDLVDKYIFKSPVTRNTTDAPEPLRLFWKRATVKGESIEALMRRVDVFASIYGQVWVGTDSNASPGASTRREELEGQVRAYAYLVAPPDMLDYAWDDQGQLLWVMFRVAHRDASDPVLSSGAVSTRYVIWTVEEWIILEERKARRQREIVVVGRGDNRIGRVPFFRVDERSGHDPYEAPALIGDIAYLDRAIGNYLSNLDAVIQDQTFSQLVIPNQGLLPGDDNYNKILEMGTKRVFTYDGEAGTPPTYISPDPKQAQLILEVVNKIIAEIYHSVGMSGERTKQDNAVGIDNSSGVAKAYDFERVNSLLAAKADVLERCEDSLAELIGLWSSFELPKDDDGEPEDLVKYPDNFDVRNLYDEFEIATNLSLLQAPDEVRRHQMTVLVDKLFPRLAKDLKAKMVTELASWPPEPPEPTLGSPAPGGGGRQGQVTKTTPATPRGSSASS